MPAERQHARRPDQADRRRQQRKERQSPVAKRGHDEHDDDDGADREPLEELRQKPPRELAVHERQTGQRLRRIHRVDDRSAARVGLLRRWSERRRSPAVHRSPSRDDESADQIAEAVRDVAVVGEPLARVEQSRQPFGERIERAGREIRRRRRARSSDARTASRRQTRLRDLRCDVAPASRRTAAAASAAATRAPAAPSRAGATAARSSRAAARGRSPRRARRRRRSAVRRPVPICASSARAVGRRSQPVERRVDAQARGAQRRARTVTTTATARIARDAVARSMPRAAASSATRARRRGGAPRQQRRHQTSVSDAADHHAVADQQPELLQARKVDERQPVERRRRRPHAEQHARSTARQIA